MEEDNECLIPPTKMDKPSQPLLKSSKDGQKSGVFVYILTFFAAVGGFLFGYDTGVVSGALIILKKRFHLTFFMEELVVSITIAGAILGALCAGPMSQHFGRKFVLLFSAIIFIIGAIFMAAAESTGELLTGRAIVGLGIGELSVL
jgi:SP family myo-inositol transporter-like MFS transporter 13